MDGEASGGRQGARDGSAGPGGGCESAAARSLRVWLDFAEQPVPGPDRAPDDCADAEVDEVLAEFGGDIRGAIRALLHDLAVLAGDFADAVSRGYVRGRTPAGGRRVVGKRTAGPG